MAQNANRVQSQTWPRVSLNNEAPWKGAKIEWENGESIIVRAKLNGDFEVVRLALEGERLSQIKYASQKKSRK